MDEVNPSDGLFHFLGNTSFDSCFKELILNNIEEVFLMYFVVIDYAWERQKSLSSVVSELFISSESLLKMKYYPELQIKIGGSD